MNKVVIALVVVIAVVCGFFIINKNSSQEGGTDTVIPEAVERDVHLGQFEDQSIGLAFDYPEGSDGYVIDDVTELVREEFPGSEVVQAYRIMNAKEKFELENSEGGREGSPAMQLMVFKNDQRQTASMWVDATPKFSNIGMAFGEVDRDAVVGGANAVRYTTDGLYLTDNIVVASGNLTYHFSGSYLEVDSVIHQDFEGIINSVRFVPLVGEDVQLGAKIDVQVACESALSYMQFETGEQADKFVAECVAGGHPEVIDRYIESFDLDGAAI